MLLPAFGLPTSPTSAMTFNSKISVALFPLATGGGLARSAIRGRFEPRVPFAAASAAPGDNLIAGDGQVLEHVAGPGIDDDRAGRDANYQVGGIVAVAIGAGATLARLGVPMVALRKLSQTVDPRRGHEDHAAAVAAVTAVGSAAGDVFFATKAGAAVAAASGADINLNSIDEHEELTA